MAARGARLRIVVGAAIAAALGALLLLLWPSPSARSSRGAAPAASRDAAALRPFSIARAPLADGSAPALPPFPVPEDAFRASLEGRVVSSETGEGIAGAELTFSRGSTAATARAGIEGAFRFEPPDEGRWLLAAVTAPGHLPFAPEWDHSPVAFDARAGQALRGIEVQLAPATPLVVTVLDPDGRPAPGAEIRILGASREAALFSLEDRFTSDDAGQVRLAAPRGAVLEARKPGFAPGLAAVDLVARAERRVLVRLGAPALPGAEPERISGRVAQRGGGAIPGALVVAERELEWGGVGPPEAQAVTAADGAFSVGPLEPGPYRLSARAEGHARAVLRQIASGSDGVTLELAPGARLRGCVRESGSGAPVTAFTVLVSERRAQLARRLALARSFFTSSGCWSVAELAPGAVAVTVAAPGYAPSDEIAAEVPESGEAIADAGLLHAGLLSGVVRGAPTRAPLPGARVAVEGTLAEAASVFPVFSETVTDAQGRFVLGGVPGRFSITVAAEGHHVRVMSGLVTAPGKDAGPVEIVLNPTQPGEEPRREFTGIGVTIALRDDALVVTSVLAGGGAAEAGIARGDAIVSVDGVPVSTLGFGGAVDAIRGAEGTTVLLRLRREGATLDVRVGRRIVRG